MLNPKFLNERRRKDPTGERSTKDGAELGVEPTDTHVFELKVWLEDGIRWGPAQSRECGISERRERVWERRSREEGEGGSEREEGTHFFPEALILIRLPSSFLTVISVLSVKIPTWTCLTLSASLGEERERSRTERELTEALRERPLKSNTRGWERESGRPE